MNQRISAGGINWNVRDAGSGPVCVLIHGTGASSHSWEPLLPHLAGEFRLIAPDLPGHGGSSQPLTSNGFSLPGMASSLAALVEQLDVLPSLVIGHSAGVAILMRMFLNQRIDPRGLISLNGAVLPFNGVAGHLFSPIAQLMAVNPLTARLFAWHAKDPAVVIRLLRGTGSRLDDAQIDPYLRLLRDPGHVRSALAMMANWDLQPLVDELKSVRLSVALLAGSNDQTISPNDADRVAALLPDASVEMLSGLGHLAHEENPTLCAASVMAYARQWGVLQVP